MTLSLTLSDVRVDADDGRTILDVPELGIAAGSALVLRGPSGAGKSTLLHVLSGLLRPTRGRVVWGERDLASMGQVARAEFRRSNIGIIFQDFLLFEELSGPDNAAIAAGFAPKAERAAIQARAGALLSRFGLPTAVRSIASFSGGERQRVSIARALSRQPGIILADEPTASLDRATAERLVSDLISIAGQSGSTLIAVSHDSMLIERLPRRLTIEHGIIVDDETGGHHA